MVDNEGVGSGGRSDGKWWRVKKSGGKWWVVVGRWWGVVGDGGELWGVVESGVEW